MNRCTVKEPGIYKILNKINGEFYIGSSINPQRRCEAHIRNLNKNANTPNIHLQRAWNKYGESAFEFIILMKTNYDTIRKEEKKLILQLEPYYNKCFDTEGGNGGKLTIERIREIFSLFSTGKYTIKKLADKFKVSSTSISYVLKRKTFPWIEINHEILDCCQQLFKDQKLPDGNIVPFVGIRKLTDEDVLKIGYLYNQKIDIGYIRKELYDYVSRNTIVRAVKRYKKEDGIKPCFPELLKIFEGKRTLYRMEKKPKKPYIKINEENVHIIRFLYDNGIGAGYIKNKLYPQFNAGTIRSIGNRRNRKNIPELNKKYPKLLDKFKGERISYKKPILQLDSNNHILNEFTCPLEAIKYLGLLKSQKGAIIASANPNSKRQFAFGYKWIYKKDHRNKTLENV